jgi:VanZ family protein
MLLFYCTRFMKFNVKIHPIYASFAIVLLVGIMYVSLLPKAELPQATLLQADKLVHFSMYAILAYFIHKGFFNQKLANAIGLACLMSILYGFIVECSQYYFTSSRMFDVFDIFANGTGAIFAYIVVNKYL